jgi:glucose-1-phosphate thymidylyltransferase
MKAIILAGGFAKRMWPLTKHQPKHLLPIAGKPMLDYIMDKLEKINEIDKIFISTNAKFESHFNDYLSNINSEKDIALFIEDVKSEEEKLGSVGALGFLINENNIDDELIVIGGDNIFDFYITEFIGFYRDIQANCVALFDIDSKIKASLYGVVELDEHRKMIDFEEKPKSPRSTLVSTACYLFTKDGVRNIVKYLNEGKDPDKIGHFIEWLYKHDNVYGFTFKGYWFDIGSFESYDDANKFFE